MTARPNGMFAIMLAPMIALVGSLVGPLAGGDAIAQTAEDNPLVLLVPFGVTDVKEAKTSARATSNAAASLRQPGRTVEVAKAPLVDILTLVECRALADPCSETLADALDVDVVVAGTVVRNTATVVFSWRGGKGERHIVSFTNGATPAADSKPLVRDLLLAIAPRKSESATSSVSSTTSSPTSSTLPTSSPSDSTETSSGTFEPTSSDEFPAGAGMEPPNSEPIEQSTSGKVRALSWATLAVGVVALGVGSVFYVKAQNTEEEIANAPANTAEEIERLRDLEQTGDNQLTAGGTLLVVGGVAAAAGIGLVIWDLSREPDKTPRIGLGPTANADGLNVTLQGTF